MMKMFLFACCSLFLASCQGAGPSVRAGAGETLPPCPDSPNCVSSLAGDERHRVDPLSLHGSPSEAMALLGQVIQGMPRAKVTFASGRYLQAEFRTLLGFVDDVTCVVDEGKGVIQIRSASRAGYWDFGVNRKRVQKIRELYEAAARTSGG
jgi:uncharacterized protein (DUF1499 family)